ncbi:MAG TPA: TetR/AcrR family transcriptional regulator [Segeticoccus sp.]|nr:TetR/AcrR family transcriptional regulator [Segeticoccus sp.]
MTPQPGERPNEPGAQRPRLQPGVARHYHSPLREQRAARTRHRIIDSARELFLSDGFAGTTIAAIARRAGVAPQTVYAVFGSKSAVLEALLSGLEESAGAAEWRRALADESDPARLLDLFAQWTASMLGTSKELLAAARGALQDPAVRELAARGDEHRRNALRALIDRIDEGGGLRAGLSPEHALDRAWMLTGVELFLAADSCGWSHDEYTEWLTELLHQQLLPAGS